MTVVQYVVREVGQPSQAFRTAIGAAEALLASDRTEAVTVLTGQRERDLNRQELRRLGQAIGEARARAQEVEAENQGLAGALGLDELRSSESLGLQATG